MVDGWDIKVWLRTRTQSAWCMSAQRRFLPWARVRKGRAYHGIALNLDMDLCLSPRLILVVIKHCR